MNPLFTNIIDVSSLYVSNMTFIQHLLTPFQGIDENIGSCASSSHQHERQYYTEDNGIEERISKLFQSIGYRPQWSHVSRLADLPVKEECKFWKETSRAIDQIEERFISEDETNFITLKDVLTNIVLNISEKIGVWTSEIAQKKRQLQLVKKSLENRQTDFFRLCAKIISSGGISHLQDETKVILDLKSMVRKVRDRHEPYEILADYFQGISLHAESIDWYDKAISIIEEELRADPYASHSDVESLFKKKLILKAKLIEQLKLNGQFERSNRELESTVTCIKRCLNQDALPSCAYYLLIEYHLRRREFVTAHSSLFELFRKEGEMSEALSKKIIHFYLETSRKINSKDYLKINFWSLARYIAQLKMDKERKIEDANFTNFHHVRNLSVADEKSIIITVLDMVDIIISSDRDSNAIIEWFLSLAPFQDETIEVFLSWMSNRLEQLEEVIKSSTKRVSRLKKELSSRDHWSKEEAQIAMARFKKEKDLHIGPLPHELCLRRYLSEWRLLLTRAQSLEEAILNQSQLEKYATSLDEISEKLRSLINEEQRIVHELMYTPTQEKTLASYMERISSKVLADREVDSDEEGEISYQENIRRGNLFNFIAFSFVPMEKQNGVIDFLKENGIELSRLWKSPLMMFVPSDRRCHPDDLNDLKAYLNNGQLKTVDDLRRVVNTH